MGLNKYICEICNKESIALYPSWVRKTCSKECTSKLKSKSKKGKLPKNWHPKIGFKEGNKLGYLNKGRPGLRGKEANRWNGGKTINSYGYIHVYSPNHPHKDGRNYFPEHCLVMEQHLGRYLTKGEIVHHLDFDKTNNHIDNLHLFPNNSEHQKYHYFLKKTILEEINGKNINKK